MEAHENKQTEPKTQKSSGVKRAVELIIFSSRWLLIPFYLGLIVAMLVYTFFYIREILTLIVEAPTMTKDVILLTTLELVDIVMIANLVKMIITGSYHSFVDKKHGYENENNSSGILKVKMATSLIGVSSIHLLQTFINEGNVDEVVLKRQLLIHGIFLVGSLTLSVIDYLHTKSEVLEANAHKK